MTTHSRTGRRAATVAAVAAAALIAAACTGEPEQTPSSALKPIDQASLQTLLDGKIRELHVPGAVVLLRTPQGEFRVGAGTTELGVQSPPDAATHFRIASNTKTMTSAVILQLAQEGKLALDDPVSRYVPGVPNGDAITIAQLLEMRSGLYNYTNSPEFAKTLDTDPTKVWTPRELLDIAFAHPPNRPPGTDYEYNNTNYALLGLVVEHAGGQPLATAMHDRLFAPLGMANTFLPDATSNALPAPYSHGYLYGSSSVALYGEPEYTPEMRTAIEAGTVTPTEYTGINHSFAAAAGGVVSTADDLATWMEALTGGKVLDAQYQRIWTDSIRPEFPDNPHQEYGYGISRLSWGSHAVTFHGGETPGYNSFMGVDPAAGMSLVVWTNQPVSPDDAPTANAIMVSVLDQIYVDSPLAAAAATTPTAAFESAPCPSPNVAGFPSLDFPANVQCGYLTVPENRSKPDGKKIKVFVARVPAASPTPQPDPIVWLAGGPGGAGSFQVTELTRQGLNADRDVIFVDQRGTHLSDPLLSCPEYDEFVNDAIGVPFTAESTTVAETAVIKACRDRLAAAGNDLAAYNSAENAADIADLRVALGIDEWNVYGVSYGSKLALTVLRDHPEGIRSVVLDSVSPPANNIAETWWQAPASSFRGIFAACAAQPSCTAAYPNLEADFFATVQRLTATPVVVQATDPATGTPLTVNIDGFPFAYAVIMASERGDASRVPKMIADMARGDAAETVAAMLALQTPPEIVGLGGHALAFTVFCREHTDLTTADAALATARSALPQFPDQVLKVQPKQGRLFTECPVWDVGSDPATTAPTVSDAPVLILEGAFDAATAPGWVDIVRPGLTRSQYVEFPFTGHSVLDKHPCAMTIM
ncbi:MAG: alpha/beta fold hydrolase, partial [Pseudonocardia sp.]